VDRGLSQTASLWPPVQTGFRFVHRGAEILSNPGEQPGSRVRRRYRGFLRDVARHATHAGKFKPAVKHFLKVTKSYWPGLFHCYDVPGLPRTNNALAQRLGSTQCHERRCTGRNVASPSVVLRGSVRIVAGLGTTGSSLSGRRRGAACVRNWTRAVRLARSATVFVATRLRTYGSSRHSYSSQLCRRSFLKAAYSKGGCWFPCSMPITLLVWTVRAGAQIFLPSRPGKPLILQR